MNTRQIITLLKDSADRIAGEATPDCLSAARLAAYQDGDLGQDEAHLVTCDRCLAQLAVIVRAAAGQDHEAAVPPFMLARAAALLDPPTRPPLRWRWAVPMAAAALLLLTLNLPMAPDPGAETSVAPTPQTRIADGELLQPRLLAPPEGSEVLLPEQVFRWSEVPGALFYDVRLVSLDGDLLLRERVDTTRWLIPDSLRLEPGAAYFVRVDAFLDDAKYLSSEHHLFRVGGVR